MNLQRIGVVSNSDGTPVLDIKPHVPTFDAPRDPRVPDWIGRLLVGYL